MQVIKAALLKEQDIKSIRIEWYRVGLATMEELYKLDGVYAAVKNGY